MSGSKEMRLMLLHNTRARVNRLRRGNPPELDPFTPAQLRLILELLRKERKELLDE